MSIAFIGHSYHQVTSSTRWFIDLIKAHDSTTLFWDESWRGGAAIDIEQVLDFDRIFVFQSEHIAREIAKRSPRKLVFIPMWDGACGLSAKWWKPFGTARILNFSWTLHQRLRRQGLNSFHCQYYPDPAKFEVVTDFSDCRGYFWQRRPEVRWDRILSLSDGTDWRSFHLHFGMDPGALPVDAPPAELSDRLNLKITQFTPQPDPAADPKYANIYFAPRASEGIGMSFLEAMARGQCVVSVNAPTMSEYIEHDVTGLLYDPSSDARLDFSERARLGASARRHVEAGFAGWKHDLDNRIPDILFSDRSGINPPRTLEQSWLLQRSKPRKLATNKPKVSVVIVTLNAKDAFSETLNSVLGQSFKDFEIVVIDGHSTDGTQRVIEQNRAHISTYLSEPDEGPYDAMNKAARVAVGEYVIFMNAGDYFASPLAISWAMESAPADADFIFGHHIYIAANGLEQLHRAPRFEDTWQKLVTGTLTPSWFSEVPCHQATFTRRTLITSSGYSFKEFQIAADHEFMFRHRLAGHKFHHCGEMVAIYTGGGMSAQRERDCVREWRELGQRYGDAEKNAEFFELTFPEIFGSRNRRAALRQGASGEMPRGFIPWIKAANRRRLKFQRRLKAKFANREQFDEH